MKGSHIPERTCVACRQKGSKNEFLRIANGGRGAYIHKNKNCLKIAIKKKSFDRALKCKIPHEIYNSLESEINE